MTIIEHIYTSAILLACSKYRSYQEKLRKKHPQNIPDLDVDFKQKTKAQKNKNISHLITESNHDKGYCATRVAQNTYMLFISILYSVWWIHQVARNFSLNP